MARGLGQQEGAAGRVEGARQAPFGGDAGDAQLDRLVGVDGPLQGLRDRPEPPADVAPRNERHRRHAGHGRDRKHEEQRRTLFRVDGGGHRQSDRDERGHGERSQESEGADEAEHA